MPETPIHRITSDRAAELNRHKEEFAAAFFSKWGDIDPREVEMCFSLEANGSKVWLEPRNEDNRRLMAEVRAAKEQAAHLESLLRDVLAAFPDADGMPYRLINSTVLERIRETLEAPKP